MTGIPLISVVVFSFKRSPCFLLLFHYSFLIAIYGGQFLGTLVAVYATKSSSKSIYVINRRTNKLPPRPPSQVKQQRALMRSRTAPSTSSDARDKSTEMVSACVFMRWLLVVSSVCLSCPNG